MKIVWIAGLAVAMSSAAWAQTTIYKHVDENGRVTYTHKPMNGATVLELDPITTIPATPALAIAPAPAAKAVATLERLDKPAVAAPTLASIDANIQRKRDNDRRKILEEELTHEEDSLAEARASISQEQQNPTLVAAVRTMQTTAEPSPAQLAEMRSNIEKASGRIRGLQSTVAEHEKNIEARKKELRALKPEPRAV